MKENKNPEGLTGKFVSSSFFLFFFGGQHINLLRVPPESCRSETTMSARLQTGHCFGRASFLWLYTLPPLPHVVKTSLNFLRGLTCAIIGAASIPFQLHCLTLIQDGGVNKEFHVRRPCSARLSCYPRAYRVQIETWD